MTSWTFSRSSTDKSLIFTVRLIHIYPNNFKIRTLDYKISPYKYIEQQDIDELYQLTNDTPLDSNGWNLLNMMTYVKRVSGAILEYVIDVAKNTSIFSNYAEYVCSLFEYLLKNNEVNHIMAILKKHPEILDDSLNIDEETAVHIVAKYGGPSLMEVLLEDRFDDYIDINEPNDNGIVPLHLAYEYQQYDIIRLLLRDRRIDINAIDDDGNTILHLIARSSRVASAECIRLLEVLINDDRIELEYQNMSKKRPYELAMSSQIKGLLMGKKAFVIGKRKSDAPHIYEPKRKIQNQNNQFFKVPAPLVIDKSDKISPVTIANT